MKSDDNKRIYPCIVKGCKVMRSKNEGGTFFTLCDKHWDEKHPPRASKSKPQRRAG